MVQGLSSGNPVTARGITTTEFWFPVVFVGVVCFSAYMRIKHGQGLSEMELGLAAAAVGIHWHGRTSLKKAIAKNGGAPLPLTNPLPPEKSNAPAPVA